MSAIWMWVLGEDEWHPVTSWQSEDACRAELHLWLRMNDQGNLDETFWQNHALSFHDTDGRVIRVLEDEEIWRWLWNETPTSRTI